MMDDRAQSQVLGAALIFGFLVLSLGIYQVFGVPQQNEEIEFKHNQEVQSDMVDLRTALVGAAATNEPRPVSVTTGTRYPSRFIALNPPPVSGTLRTKDAGEMSFSDEQDLENVCGRAPSTKFIEYDPSYNEYANAHPINFENSFIFRDTGGNTIVDSNQVLIQGSQITLIPVVGDLSRTTVGTTTFDLIPTTKTGATKITSEDTGDADTVSTLTVPTELAASTWENEILDDEIANGFVQGVNDVAGDNVEIVLEGADTSGGPDHYTIRCTPVGINEEPTVSSLPQLPPGGSSVNPGGNINPVTPVTFKDAVLENNASHCDGATECAVNITFENQLSDDVEVVQARFTYYYEGAQGGAGGVGTFDPPDFAKYDGNIYEITGPAEPAGNQTLSSGSTEQVHVFFAQSQSALSSDQGDFGVEEGDWFILRLTYKDEDGNKFSSTYFIPPHD